MSITEQLAPRRTFVLIVVAVAAIAALVAIFGTHDVTGGGPERACPTEAATFQTAVYAYHQTRGEWPAGDEAAVAQTLVTATLLQSTRFQYGSTKPSPPSNHWSYDATTHKVVTNCT